MREGALVDLSVTHEGDRRTLHELVEPGNAVEATLEQVVHHEERGRGHEPTRESGVGPHHGVLDGVGDEKDEHEVDEGELGDLRLPEEPERHHDERVDGRGAPYDGQVLHG